jgi:hexosaminidase
LGAFSEKTEEHFIRADFAGINYARSMYNAIITPFFYEDSNMQIKLDTEIKDLDIYYKFDNTEPDLYSDKYKDVLSVPKDAIYFLKENKLKMKNGFLGA